MLRNLFYTMFMIEFLSEYAIFRTCACCKPCTYSWSRDWCFVDRAIKILKYRVKPQSNFDICECIYFLIDCFLNDTSVMLLGYCCCFLLFTNCDSALCLYTALHHLNLWWYTQYLLLQMLSVCTIKINFTKQMLKQGEIFIPYFSYNSSSKLCMPASSSLQVCHYVTYHKTLRWNLPRATEVEF